MRNNKFNNAKFNRVLSYNTHGLIWNWKNDIRNNNLRLTGQKI